MIRKGLALLMLVALAGAAAMSSISAAPAPARAAGNTYYVSYLGSNIRGTGSEGNPWRTISHAVSRVDPGDTIRLADDNNEETDDYVENVLIDKPVTITSYDQAGARPQVRAKSPLAPVFEISYADGVILKNLDIYGADAPAEMMTPGYSQRAGVLATHSSGSVIEDCRIGWDPQHRNLHGVYVEGCDDWLIRRNVICSSVQTGICMIDTYNSSVMDNACSSNGEHGIALRSMTARITIMNNAFNDNRGNGILIAGNPGNTIASNTISNNGRYGIDMAGLTGGHAVYLNTLSDNALGNVVAGNEVANSWVSPQPIYYAYQGQKYSGIVGNYWSDYTGLDDGTGGRAAGDGIGDTHLPYTGVYGASDGCPLMTIMGVKADFAAARAAGLAPLEVRFEDRSLGDILTWEWDLDGDDITDSTERNPSFTYEETGAYTVTLTVTGRSGSDTRIKRACVLVMDALAWTTVGADNPAIIQTSDGAITLHIPAGAAGRAFTLVIAEGTGDDPLQGVSGYRSADTFFDIEGPDQLNREVTIWARYSDSDLDAAKGEPGNLALCYLDAVAGKWVVADTTVDAEGQTLMASTSHFSRWAIVARGGGAGRSPFPGWAWGLLGAAGALALVSISAIAGYSLGRR